MQELAKTYDPRAVEDKWYAYWLAGRFFESHPNPDKQPYTVVIPPPNVTGVLHMGHMLNNTIQDVLVRKARMEGREACWVPGTDHASIATEAKVVAMLKERGIEKSSLSREEFLAYAWEWKEKYGGIILEQLKKLGCSCDWARTRFTMEPDMSAAVIRTFVDLYNKGLIYRGVRMVNWDPQGRTALSDEEVIPKDVTGKMYHLRYEILAGEPDVPASGHQSAAPNSEAFDYLTIATSRPETIMADVAVAVHPQDPRYQHLVGRTVRIPLVGREIPVIADARVAIDFGTGTLKITPAHDLVDYEIGLAHNLPVIDVLNDDGTLNELAGAPYAGLDRFAARRAIVKNLEEAGLLTKAEEYATVSQTSERTGAVVEPRLSLQWFLKMEDLAKPALEAVESDAIRLHPPRFKNMYRSWMENVRDWCISRQLWWGQQIPAYYLPDGSCVVAESAAKALRLARQQSGNPDLTASDLHQDPDVLDTWFSSWLWPMSVFDGITHPDNPDINYYYPTNDLVTAPEILFFWVARMIVAGLEYRREVPFRNVYLTGIVRDKQGRKMAKQLGNSPDPLDLIAQYGADGVRTGMLFSSPAGNDLPFDEKLCEQGRNFSNKIWNAYRLVSGWDVQAETDATTTQTAESNALAARWFAATLHAALADIHDQFDKFRVSDALQATYRLIWEDFCGGYLEMIKPAYAGEDQRGQLDPAAHAATLDFFEQLMQLAHPFMPFLTEEIWQALRPRPTGASICVATFPTPYQPVDQQLIANGQLALDVISQVRKLRNAKGLSPRVTLPLAIRTDDNQPLYTAFGPILTKLANVSVSFTREAVAGVTPFMVRSDEFFVRLAGELDADKERSTLQRDLDYQRGFRASVAGKLANAKFVDNAKPEVIANERQKLADAEAKIRALEEALSALPLG